MHFPYSAQSILAGITILCSSIAAHASLTLTLDTANRTLTWNGAATSDPIPLDEEDSFHLRIGFGTWIGGLTDANNDLEKSFLETTTISYPQSGADLRGIFINDNDPAVITSENSLYVWLGIYMSDPDSTNIDSFALSVVASGETFSYLQSRDDAWAALQSMNGQELYFQKSYGGLGTFDFGPAAGVIVVIPEPGTTTLFFGSICTGLLILYTRIKKRKSTT